MHSCARCAARARSITTTRSRPGGCRRAARCAMCSWRRDRCGRRVAAIVASRRLVVVAAAAVVVALVAAPAARAAPPPPTHVREAYPGIGRAATARELQAWDIDVRPDFKGLPRGAGSVAQGQLVWEGKCASCPGIFGESGEVFNPIVGGTTADD